MNFNIHIYYYFCTFSIILNFHIFLVLGKENFTQVNKVSIFASCLDLDSNNFNKSIDETFHLQRKRSLEFGIDPFASKPNLPLPSQILDELFGRRLFNTTMNYIVPLFEVGLPMHSDQGSTVHLAMQAFLGLFSAIAWISTVAIPVLLTELIPFGIRKRNANEPIHSTEDEDSDAALEYSITSGKLSSLFNKKIAKQIGLEWEPCLCKTICEAHRSSNKYGLVALPFLLFSQSQGMFQDAAKFGTESKENCADLFPCFFDILELTNYLMDAFYYRNSINSTNRR